MAARAWTARRSKFSDRQSKRAWKRYLRKRNGLVKI